MRESNNDLMRIPIVSGFGILERGGPFLPQAIYFPDAQCRFIPKNDLAWKVIPKHTTDITINTVQCPYCKAIMPVKVFNKHTFRENEAVYCINYDLDCEVFAVYDAKKNRLFIGLRHGDQCPQCSAKWALNKATYSPK